MPATTGIQKAELDLSGGSVRAVSTRDLRFWVQSVRDTFEPREMIPPREAPKLIPETFLAAALRNIEACCDDLEDER